MEFLSHDFGSRYASKLIKNSKDADYSLVSKKILSQKMARWAGAQRQVYWPKRQKPTPIVTSPTESSKPETKKLFSIWTIEDSLNPQMVWTAL